MAKLNIDLQQWSGPTTPIDIETYINSVSRAEQKIRAIEKEKFNYFGWGQIPCPICGEQLDYGVDENTGDISGKCSSDICLVWG